MNEDTGQRLRKSFRIAATSTYQQVLAVVCYKFQLAQHGGHFVLMEYHETTSGKMLTTCLCEVYAIVAVLCLCLTIYSNIYSSVRPLQLRLEFVWVGRYLGPSMTRCVAMVECRHWRDI